MKCLPAPEVAAAIEYSIAHPEESVTSVAARFGVIRSTLFTRLHRDSRLLPYTERKQRRWNPIIAYAYANPTESVAAIAALFTVNLSSLRYAMVEWLGTSERVKPPRKFPWVCRVCGEGDPDKFSKSSKYSSGLQDKCKACARNAYLTGYGKDRKHYAH